MQSRLKRVKATQSVIVNAFVKTLDADSHRLREEAMKSLTELGDAATLKVEQALNANPSTEKKKRLEKLLSELDSRKPPRGDVLRGIRCLAVLEYFKTDEARRLIAEVAGGLESARLTSKAKESLERLRRHGGAR